LINFLIYGKKCYCRDTTVQSLTVQPTVNNGVVTFQDSALVRAARDGSVLLVDEADKAPTQVTCILKVIIVSNGRFFTHSPG